MPPEAKSLVGPVIIITVGIIVASLMIAWSLEQGGIWASDGGIVPEVIDGEQ